MNMWCGMVYNCSHYSAAVTTDCVLPGGEAPDSRALIQHQGPVGDPQELPATPPRDWTWAVWKGLRRPVEQHNPSGNQNSQARYVVAV